MSWKTNDGIGKAGERRIKKKLEELGAKVILREEHNGHPDLFFEKFDIRFAVECKTVQGIYSGRIGAIKISGIEFDECNKISKDVPVLIIVEVRPGRGEPLYVVVPWFKITDSRKRPFTSISLTVWECFRLGLNLNYFFEMLNLGHGILQDEGGKK